MRYINLLTYLITYFTYFTYPRRNSKLNSNYDQKQESQITQTHRAYADVCVCGGGLIFAEIFQMHDLIPPQRCINSRLDKHFDHLLEMWVRNQ